MTTIFTGNDNRLVAHGEARGKFISGLTRRRLFVLDDTDLGGAQHPTVELEALLLDVEDGVVLLVGLRRHEGSLVLVGVKLDTAGVETLEAVLGEGLHE